LEGVRKMIAPDTIVPLAGRFISEDPARLGGEINLYRYVADSPTNVIDPSGLRIVPILGESGDLQNREMASSYLVQDPAMNAMISQMEESSTADGSRSGARAATTCALRLRPITEGLADKVSVAFARLGLQRNGRRPTDLR